MALSSTLNPFTGKLQLVNDPSDDGDVVGPSLSTDNAIARYDGTTGKVIQNSSVKIKDDGTVIATANGVVLNDGTNDWRLTVNTNGTLITTFIPPFLATEDSNSLVTEDGKNLQTNA